MADTAEFLIGSEVACTDGVCGELRRVVIDPVARALTHLVVEPKHRQNAGHLVPIELVSSTGEEIQLGCTKSEFDALEQAEETQFLPGVGGPLGYEPAHTLLLPYFGLAGGMSMGLGPTGVGGMELSSDPHAVTYDHIPAGEVEVRRGDHVDATDGAIGRVQGLVVDPGDHHVTHILLDDGHLWGEKRVAIPIKAVTRVGEVIRLSLTKDQVRDLPPVEIEQSK